MNKWLRLTCAGALVAGTLSVCALAADFTASAEHLNDLGLFQGTGNG